MRPRLAARRVARNYIPKSESNSDTTRFRFISRQFRFRFGESVQLMFLQTDFGELESVFVDDRVLKRYDFLTVNIAAERGSTN